MKRLKYYGTIDRKVLSQEELKILERVEADSALSLSWRSIISLDSFGTYICLKKAAARGDGGNRKRGIADYEQEVGIDILSHLQNTKAQETKYLDIGCGEGYCAEEVSVLCKAFGLNVQVYAGDIQPPLRKTVVEIEEMDVLNLNGQRRYDLICASFLLPWIVDPLKGIINMYNALGQGGTVAATIIEQCAWIEGEGIYAKDGLVHRLVETAGGSVTTKRLKGHPHHASVLVMKSDKDKISPHKLTYHAEVPPGGFPVRTYYYKNNSS